MIKKYLPPLPQTIIIIFILILLILAIRINIPAASLLNDLLSGLY